MFILLSGTGTVCSGAINQQDGALQCSLIPTPSKLQQLKKKLFLLPECFMKVFSPIAKKWTKNWFYIDF